jgi:hypothetical protein
MDKGDFFHEIEKRIEPLRLEGAPRDDLFDVRRWLRRSLGRQTKWLRRSLLVLGAPLEVDPLDVRVEESEDAVDVVVG